MSFDNCSLFLCPKQYNFTIENRSSLISNLQKIKFIAARIDPSIINPSQTDESYFSGEKFLDDIAYMGCAPSIQFEASNDSSNFCHIRIHHYEPARLIVSQKQERAPHCPACHKPVKNWPQFKTDNSIICPLCNTTSAIADYNWRKMAGYAKLFIEITDIFPKEAIPQQNFLDELAEITKVDWLYFYSCQ